MAVRPRRTLFVGAASMLHYCGLLKAQRFLRRTILRRNEVCVLGLHRVLKDDEVIQSNSLPGIVLREKTFVQILQYLAQRFQFVTIDELLKGPSTASPGSKLICLLTFDDGWRDNYTTAYPWLKKYGIPAIVFLATGMLETQSGFWVEQLVRAWRDPARRQQIQLRFRRAAPGKEKTPDIEEVIEFCKRMPADERQPFLCGLTLSSDPHGAQYAADQMLTWEQVREMSHNGIDFGSHTVTHPLLTYENDVTVEQELAASKQALQEKLEKEVRAFAYPNGDWDERIRNKVKAAGYQFAFTTRRGWYLQGQDPYAIPRIMLHEGKVTGLYGRFSPAMLGLRLSGWY